MRKFHTETFFAFQRLFWPLSLNCSIFASIETTASECQLVLIAPPSGIGTVQARGVAP